VDVKSIHRSIQHFIVLLLSVLHKTRDIELIFTFEYKLHVMKFLSLQTSHPLPGEVGECLTTDRGTHYYVLCVESEDSQGDTTARYYIHYTITFSTVF